MTRPLRVAHLATIDLTHRVLLFPQLRRLQDSGFQVTAISAPGPWVRFLEQEGICHIAWRHVTRSWDPVADARAFLELLSILRRERFDLIHTHNAKPGVLGRIAARLIGVPCVVNTVHGFDARPDDRLGKRAAFMGLEWLAARFSDVELYQSRADMARARRIGVSRPPQAVFLGNGTDVTRFDPSAVPADAVGRLRRELGVPDGSPVVGTMGRLVRDKGYREFFAAARKVRAVSPEVTFLAVGDRDPAKAEALTDGEIERAREDVIFAGWREDVPELLALMDVFVLASWREGVPRSAIEAAAMGRPLVLTDIPGCHQVARQGIEALFVATGDPAALTGAISRLLEDHRLRERLGAAARVRALERLDERAVIGVLLDQYRLLLARKGIVG